MSPRNPNALAAMPRSARAVYAALVDHPDSTTVELADYAKVARSTAQNALRALESPGLVTRVRVPGAAGGVNRQPDIWTAAAAHRPAASKPKTTKPSRGRGARKADAAPADETPAEASSSSGRKSGTPVVALSKATPRSTASLAEHKARRSDRTDRTVTEINPSPGVVLELPVGKLGKGQLQQLVLDQMQTKPTEEWSVGELGRALDRSQGAIANALDRFAQRGLLELSNQSPRRYRLTNTSDPEWATATDDQPESAIEATGTTGRRKGRPRRK